MAKSIEQVLGEIFSKQKKTIAIAESCTGGGVSNMLTSVSGSSAYFLGSIVAYSNQAKIDLLKISEQIIQEEGAVSRTCAVAMAQNIRSLLRTNIGLAVTGLAGPAGGSGTKPVGTVYIAVTSGERQMCKLFKFEGSRQDVREKASQFALKMVKEFIGIGI